MKRKSFLCGLVVLIGAMAAGSTSVELGEKVVLRWITKENAPGAIWIDQQGKNLVRADLHGNNWDSSALIMNGGGFRFSKNEKRFIFFHLAYDNTDFSFSVWMKASTVNDGQLISNTTVPPCWMLRLLPSGDGVTPYVYFAGNPDKPGSACKGITDMEIGKWYLISGSFNRKGEFKLYVNGEQEAGIKLASYSSVRLKSATTVGGPNWCFDGELCELTFYKGILDKKRMQEIFDMGKSVFQEK